jgi:hypothetical protein
MRHPFDGIIIPESRSLVSPAAEVESAMETLSRRPSRRSILQWLLAGGGALLGLAGGRRARADGSALDEKPAGHRLYFVVPKDARKLTAERRKALDIQGDYLNGLKGNKELATRQGFLAWFTPAQAEKVGKESDVATVHALSAADIELPQPPANGPATLVVPLAPDTWRTKPAADTYQSAADVAKQWSKAFAEHKGVQVTARGKTGLVYVAFGDGPIPEKVLEAIKNHPQVVGPQWQGMPTTLAIGEEGGPITERRGEEGKRPPINPTTMAIGEEGGPRPTTRAVGEEGGKPPVLPPGRVTTHALGEEGAGPPPQVTTQALGEEGG